MSWFLLVLIGFAFGGFVGIIAGLMIGDNYWRTKLCPYCDHDYKRYMKNKELKHSESEVIEHD